MIKEVYIVNTAIVMACAEGVTNHDSNLLAKNGGYITITKDWAKPYLVEWGLSRGVLAPHLRCHHKDLMSSRSSFYLM